MTSLHRVACLLCGPLLLAAASHARAVTIEITNFLDANDFGVTEAVVAGVLARAGQLWESWLPTGLGNMPADHPQNASFGIVVAGKNIDASGENPAITKIILPMARPTGEVLIRIDINTDDDATGAMFWDATPATTTPAEFSVSLGLGAGKWRAANGDLGFGKFDMLTVMLHELGHALGFSRDYGDFANWADKVWNQANPVNKIDEKGPHFFDNLNLMSSAAGFAPDGKSGRSFIQPLDVFALQEAFGYKVPEPPTLPLLAIALAGALAMRRGRGMRARVRNQPARWNSRPA